MATEREVRLGWTRLPDGTYRCDLLGHCYEIRRGKAFAWIVVRDGMTFSQADTLADAKRLGVRAAQHDNGIEAAT